MYWIAFVLVMYRSQRGRPALVCCHGHGQRSPLEAEAGDRLGGTEEKEGKEGEKGNEGASGNIRIVGHRTR